MSDQTAKAEVVTITIDGKQVQVPKGMNLIEAAAAAGVDIPHYCYHKHLSIAGNCRMCQVEVQGQAKLQIACNMAATEGLAVKTHFSSPEVAEAQRATLEFLLINHPLDCTVCDQAGHCKLQDYYYEYDSGGSRFIEEKVHKVKAEPLGPQVIYDGERCIMCTRCVRFCDEITGTSELGAFNRGDRGEIGIYPGRELDNPLSGSVVDLCPVGALTHRKWRFNTRYWYTSEQRTICPGCSTGCNARGAVRDDRIVQVKARLNSEVNREWMCDEGRYGFDRFQPATRATTPSIRKDAWQNADWGTALNEVKKLKGDGTAVFLSPFLTLEEMWTSLRLAEKVLGLKADSPDIAVQLRQRPLSETEAILISPDYAPNARAYSLFDSSLMGDNWRSLLEQRYEALLAKLRAGNLKRVLIVGDDAILDRDLDSKAQEALLRCECAVAISPRGAGSGTGAHEFCSVTFPGRTVNEKNGVFINRDLRLQRINLLLSGPIGSLADWMILGRIAAACGSAVIPADLVDDRGIFREMVKNVPNLKNLTLRSIGDLGLPLSAVEKLGAPNSGVAAEAGSAAG